MKIVAWLILLLMASAQFHLLLMITGATGIWWFVILTINSALFTWSMNTIQDKKTPIL